MNVSYGNYRGIEKNDIQLTYFSSLASKPQDKLILNNKSYNIIPGFQITILKNMEYRIESNDNKSKRVYQFKTIYKIPTFDTTKIIRISKNLNKRNSFFGKLLPRQIHLSIFIIVGLLLGYAVYSIRILKLKVCIICFTQLFFYSLIGVTAYIAFFRDPSSFSSKIYSVLIFIFSIVGMWLSGRQVWIEKFPEDEVPACGPSLGYMIKEFPFFDKIRYLIRYLLMGDGNCVDISRQFLGLSMAGWSFVWFLVIFILSIVAIKKSTFIVKEDISVESSVTKSLLLVVVVIPGVLAFLAVPLLAYLHKMGP
jgi:protein dithiol:quinone oxidoreductase